MNERFRSIASNILGITEPEYTVEVFRPERRSEIRLTVKNEDRVLSVRHYASSFHAGVNVGRERMLAKLEWVSGVTLSMAGISTFVLSNNEFQFLIGFGMIFVGGMLLHDGRERRGITSSIMRRLDRN